MGLKARVKATGAIVEVDECGGQVFKDMGWYYMDMRGRCYKSEDLDFSDNTPFDYWARLEHTYAGMAMQGILVNIDLFMSLANKKAADYPAKYTVAEFAKECAHALVEKVKEVK